MSTLGEFFQKELAGKTFPEGLLEGEIENLRVSREPRGIEVGIRFPQFVAYESFAKLAEALEGFGAVRVLPRFPGKALPWSACPPCVPP